MGIERVKMAFDRSRKVPGEPVLKIVRAHKVFWIPTYGKVFGTHKLWIGRFCIQWGGKLDYGPDPM